MAAFHRHENDTHAKSLRCNDGLINRQPKCICTDGVPDARRHYPWLACPRLAMPHGTGSSGNRRMLMRSQGMTCSSARLSNGSSQHVVMMSWTYLCISRQSCGSHCLLCGDLPGKGLRVISLFCLGRFLGKLRLRGLILVNPCCSLSLLGQGGGNGWAGWSWGSSCCSRFLGSRCSWPGSGWHCRQAGCDGAGPEGDLLGRCR